MTIHYLEETDTYVISHNGEWLPGAFDSRLTANRALQLRRWHLEELDGLVGGRVITMEDMERYRSV